MSLIFKFNNSPRLNPHPYIKLNIVLCFIFCVAPIIDLTSFILSTCGKVFAPRGLCICRESIPPFALFLKNNFNALMN